jgi:hypothetical protein
MSWGPKESLLKRIYAKVLTCAESIISQLGESREVEEHGRAAAGSRSLTPRLKPDFFSLCCGTTEVGTLTLLALWKHFRGSQ